MNVPHDALFQICINGFALPNRRAAQAPEIFKTTSSPEPLIQIQNNFTEFVPHIILYQNFTNSFTPLNKRAGTRAPDKKYL